MVNKDESEIRKVIVRVLCKTLSVNAMVLAPISGIDMARTLIYWYNDNMS